MSYIGLLTKRRILYHCTQTVKLYWSNKLIHLLNDDHGPNLFQHTICDTLSYKTVGAISFIKNIATNVLLQEVLYFVVATDFDYLLLISSGI